MVARVLYADSLPASRHINVIPAPAENVLPTPKKYC